MNPTALFVDISILYLVLVPFTKYCVIDSNQPNATLSWSAFLLPQTLLTLSGALAIYFHSVKSEYMFVATMLFVGMLFGAAAVDPRTVIRQPNESFVSYGKRFVLERARRVAVSKLAVYIAAIIGTYTFPQYWYMAVFFVVLHLHYYKMATCIVAESGTPDPQSAPKHIQRKWQLRAIPAAFALGFMLIGAKAVFDELNYVPDSWGAFGGFTLMSAAVFLLGSFVRADA